MIPWYSTFVVGLLSSAVCSGVGKPSSQNPGTAAAAVWYEYLWSLTIKLNLLELNFALMSSSIAPTAKLEVHHAGEDSDS